jgi:uncharacterized protein
MLMTAANDRLLRVPDLIDRPGASRRLDVALPAPDDLQLPLAEVTGSLRLCGVVESVVEGLLVRATLTAPLRSSCARCLVALTEQVEADVVELFTAADDADADPEPGYTYAEGVVDLGALLRDALVPSVPLRSLCSSDCQGLCPQCGTDRNVAACDCIETNADSRWAALEGLRLPD